MDWEFYVCCLTNQNAVWTRWRWRCSDAGRVIEPQTDFTTLTACKADAVLHGFDPASSRFREVASALPLYDGYVPSSAPARPTA